MRASMTCARPSLHVRLLGVRVVIVRGSMRANTARSPGAPLIYGACARTKCIMHPVLQHSDRQVKNSTALIPSAATARVFPQSSLSSFLRPSLRIRENIACSSLLIKPAICYNGCAH
eukprot:IDg22029t1